jgi:hypothetical protein
MSSPSENPSPRGWSHQRYLPLTATGLGNHRVAYLMICVVLSVVVRQCDVSASGMGFVLLSLLWLVI